MRFKIGDKVELLENEYHFLAGTQGIVTKIDYTPLAPFPYQVKIDGQILTFSDSELKHPKEDSMKKHAFKIGDTVEMKNKNGWLPGLQGKLTIMNSSVTYDYKVQGTDGHIAYVWEDEIKLAEPKPEKEKYVCWGAHQTTTKIYFPHIVEAEDIHQAREIYADYTDHLKDEIRAIHWEYFIENKIIGEEVSKLEAKRVPND